VNTGGTNGGALTFATTPGGAAATERMRIDSSGNVGIGTTSGGGKLEVAGGYFSLLDAGLANFLTITPAATSIINASTALQLNTGGTEKMKIDSSGNVISAVPTTPPTLAGNSQMVFNLTSNTNLRISVRGTDGTTRTANITLA
jgi:hypothetical protein